MVLALAIPTADQVEILRRAVRYLMAAEGVKTKAKQLNLTDEQKGQLSERESTEQAAAESALSSSTLRSGCRDAEEGGIGIEKVAAGGRPLQTTLNEKKQAMIHERIVELITSVQQRVFSDAGPGQDRRAVPAWRRNAADARSPDRRGGGRFLLVPGFHPANDKRCDPQSRRARALRKDISGMSPGQSRTLCRRQVRGRTKQGTVQGRRRRGRDRSRLRIPDAAPGDPATGSESVSAVRERSL